VVRPRPVHAGAGALTVLGGRPGATPSPRYRPNQADQIRHGSSIASPHRVGACCHGCGRLAGPFHRPDRAAGIARRWTAGAAKDHKDSKRRIDAAVAAVMAHDRAAVLGGDRGPSIYV
jgi:hypothetical protein